MEDDNLGVVSNSAVETQPTEPTVSGVEDNTIVQATEGQSENNVDNSSEQTDIENNTEKFDDGEKFAKAFSKRLNKEKDKMSKEYEPFKKVVGLAAKQFGMSEEDYIKSILEEYADDDTAPAEKDEKDLLIEELLAEKREKEVAQSWEKQAKALQTLDADVSMEKITDEMLTLADEKKIPLEYIYAYEMLTSNRESFEKSIEEKVMAKINKVNNTAGSLTSSKVETQTPSINSMSKEDFATLKERVKRGEKINL